MNVCSRKQWFFHIYLGEIIHVDTPVLFQKYKSLDISFLEWQSSWAKWFDYVLLQSQWRKVSIGVNSTPGNNLPKRTDSQRWMWVGGCTDLQERWLSTCKNSKGIISISIKCRLLVSIIPRRLQVSAKNVCVRIKPFSDSIEVILCIVVFVVLAKYGRRILSVIQRLHVMSMFKWLGRFSGMPSVSLRLVVRCPPR